MIVYLCSAYLVFLLLCVLHVYVLIDRMGQFEYPGLPLPLFGHCLSLATMKPEDIWSEIREQLTFLDIPKAFTAMMGTRQLVILQHPVATAELLRSGENTKKGYMYDHTVNWLGEGILTSYGAKWRERRKMITPAFHFKKLCHGLLTMNKVRAIVNDGVES